ncbi:MAG TPA: ABC transporter permease [Blastocatellia bacterium]|nr:ABC transporter permease [Blastocatellia bacterium]
MSKISKLIFFRVVQAVLVLLGISLLIFGLLAIAGGDALTALHGHAMISDETLAKWRGIYGLDQPLWVRYGRWLSEIVNGSLGYSRSFQAPVANIIWPRLWRSFALASVAMVISWTVSLTVGIAAAVRFNSWLDRVCDLVVLLSASMPRLVLSLTALTFITHLAWFGADQPTGETQVGAFSLQVLPPALILCVPLISLFLPLTRTSVKMVLSQEYVSVARAKGLPERIVLFRHVLRPALNPMLTIFGYELGSVISGSVIVEKVLGWPGLGALSVSAVQSRDLPLLMGVVLVTATAVLVGNLLADILIRLNDPRLRQ